MVNHNYGLYQTFTSEDSRQSKKNLTLAQKKTLVELFTDLSGDEKEAVFMLICEHARIHDNFIYDFSNLMLPYSLVQSGNDITFDFDNLPKELKWILWSFSKVIQK